MERKPFRYDVGSYFGDSEWIFWTCVTVGYLVLAVLDAFSGDTWLVLFEVVAAMASAYWAVEARGKVD